MTIASLFRRAQARPGSVGENLKDVERLWENLRSPSSGGWNNNLLSHQPLHTASSLILSRSSPAQLVLSRKPEAVPRSGLLITRTRVHRHLSFSFYWEVSFLQGAVSQSLLSPFSHRVLSSLLLLINRPAFSSLPAWREASSPSLPEANLSTIIHKQTRYYCPELSFIFFNSLFYVSECFVCMYVCAPHVYLVPREVRRGCPILWNWRYRCLWQLCGFWEPRSSIGETNALEHWAISPDSQSVFSQVHFFFSPWHVSFCPCRLLALFWARVPVNVNV